MDFEESEMAEETAAFVSRLSEIHTSLMQKQTLNVAKREAQKKTKFNIYWKVIFHSIIIIHQSQNKPEDNDCYHYVAMSPISQGKQYHH